MAQSAKKKATYDDLFTVPENMTGQIINGELVTMPRPSPRHAKACSSLEVKIGGPYQFGKGGPGGWIILFEPEIKFGDNFLVPDIAGWKKERLPAAPETNYFEITPDWVCEVLSPSTAGIDKVKKMPIYAGHDVWHLWFIDPVAQTLEVFQLESRGWILLSSFTGNDVVSTQPFKEIKLNLSDLWW